LKNLVLIPVFNEERTVKAVLDQIRQHTSADILVVNDGSTDASLAEIKKGNVTCIINHERNLGPGAALISGFNFAVKHNYDVLITLDADGQHEARYIPEFLEAISDSDMVVGSRFLPDSKRRSQPPRDREMANRTLTKFVRKRIDYPITDCSSGFRAYRVSSLRKLRITEKGYAWPFQLWIQAHEAGFRVKEIPIPLVYLDYKRDSHGEFRSMSEAMAKAKDVMKKELDKNGDHKGAFSKKTVVWTRDNVGEVVPDVVTPLSWSVLDPIVNSALLDLGQRLGLQVNKTRFFDCFRGRVYLNMTAFESVMKSLNPIYLWRGITQLHRLVKGMLQLFWLMCILPFQIRRSLVKIPVEVSKLKKSNPSKLSSSAILNRIAGLQSLLKACMKIHMTGTMMEGIFVSLLRSLIRKWGGKYSTISYSDLLTGLTGMKSAEPGIALWRLSKKASLNGEIRKTILNTKPSKVFDILATSKQGKEFASEIRDFLDEYGSFSLQEFELSYPRWKNDPNFIFKTLRSYMLPGNTLDPLIFENRQRLTRLEATQKIKKELTNSGYAFFYRRLLFSLVLFEAQHYVLWRENMKQTFVLVYGQLSNLYRELAAKFVDSGLLQKDEDLYFLTAKEIGLINDGQLKLEKIRELLDTRKRKRKENLLLNFPKLVETDNGMIREIGECTEENEPKTTVVLKGIGCSIGRTTAKAQVVLDPATCEKFEKGGILVAPYTSPSWTPLFLIAGAVVTEFGGVSSHGAIVAREYGIPCVTSVKNATKVIRTGEILTVDGGEGVVYIGSLEKKGSS
jgi:glycosyltransferase involved in cell wall biosynthesis/phosphohistidine swiveling domain-containing protein